jgi:hypothetical protein
MGSENSADQPADLLWSWEFEFEFGVLMVDLYKNKFAF